jgi:hypothetical protein
MRILSVKYATLLTALAILFHGKCTCPPTKPHDLYPIISNEQRSQNKMPYLIKPPVHSINSCNPLFTYTLTNSTPFELRKLKDLQDWGWEVSVHFHDDRDYLDAIRETDKAIKKRRRRTQMLYGDLVGDGPRLTLEEVYEREATKNTAQGLYETKERGEVGDEASIMSRMTQQRDWVCWADEEADLEADKPNVSESQTKFIRQM